jgi:hypothetical protein
MQNIPKKFRTEYLPFIEDTEFFTFNSQPSQSMRTFNSTVYNLKVRLVMLRFSDSVYGRKPYINISLYVILCS